MITRLLIGRLPPMVMPDNPKSPRHRLIAPWSTAVVHGMGVGLASGGVCGFIWFLPGAVIGAAVGLALSVVPSVVVGAIVAGVAVRWHTPLRYPQAFHRAVCIIIVVAVAVLVALIWVPAQGGEFQPYTPLLAIPTVTVLCFCRWAAIRIVVTQAQDCGWTVPD